MIHILVTILVQRDRIDDFVAIARRAAAGAIREAGCVRFEVLHDLHEPRLFMLAEVWQSEAALAAHRQTPHYWTWRQEVSDVEGMPHDHREFREIT